MTHVMTVHVQDEEMEIMRDGKDLIIGYWSADGETFMRQMEIDYVEEITEDTNCRRLLEVYCDYLDKMEMFRGEY